MAISDDVKNKLIDNNRKITELLSENENLLREAGYTPPTINFALDHVEKIGFPSGYIRTVKSFYTQYHLREICPNNTTRQNIAYALETSDLINFIINRVNIWGSVKTIFFKLAIVNFVSVLEAIILEAANNICYNPSICDKIKTCPHHFSKAERNTASKAIVKLAQIGVLDYDVEKISRVQEIIDLRNRIHIRLTKGNEMNLDDFTLILYNEVVYLLQDIDRQIYEKGVPYYRCN